jgi:hypothetical protein
LARKCVEDLLGSAMAFLVPYELDVACNKLLVETRSSRASTKTKKKKTLDEQSNSKKDEENKKTTPTATTKTEKVEKSLFKLSITSAVAKDSSISLLAAVQST